MAVVPLKQRLATAWGALRGKYRAPRARKAGAGDRQVRTGLHTSFRGAEASRLLEDWFARCMSPDDELRYDMKVMRARARDLSRNDPMCKHFLNLATANVLGARGPRLQAQVRDARGNLDEKTNEVIEEAWERWSSGPVTADRRMTLAQFEHLQLKTAARDGEMLTRMPIGANYRFGLALQGFDPDLLDETYNLPYGRTENEVRLGVEVDQDLAPVAYHVWDGLYRTDYLGRRRIRIDASEMLHLYITERVNQMRGITWFAPVLIHTQHAGGYAEAALVHARVGAAQMAFITQDDESMAGPAQSTDPNDPLAPAELEVNPGGMLRLAPGEKVESWTPNSPNAAYEQFMRDVTRRIATGLGVGYAQLSGDYSQANYSSMRQALLSERDLWEMLQDWWVSSFRQPVYERWLNAAILSGELQLASADWTRYKAVRWVSRGWDWVDPLKDVEASHLELFLGLTSLRRVLAQRGEDIEEVFEERAADELMAKQLGLTLDFSLRGAPNIPDLSTAKPGSGDETDEGEGTPLDAGAGDTASRALAGRVIKSRLNGSANGGPPAGSSRGRSPGRI
jgi:lambda family phage portal protein